MTLPTVAAGADTVPAATGPEHGESWRPGGRRVLLRFLVKRIAMMVVTMLAASFAIYASAYLIPGDPVAVLTKGKIQDPQAIAELKAEFRLDQPLLTGYVSWLEHGLRGDFGKSIVYRQEVLDLVGSRLAVTFSLVAYATVLILAVGLSLGAIAALRRGGVASAVTMATTFMVAVPGFVAAAVLILLFSVTFPVFPAFGAGDGLVDRVYHLTLPAVALSLSSIALVARVTQVAMADELGKEHVQTGWSRGLTGGQVFRRHVVRNSLVPITTVVGVTFAYLVVGAVVVENAFSLSGLGTLLTQAVLARDFALVQFIVLLMIVTFIAVNTFVDILYSLIDPRIRLGGGQE